GRAVSGWRVGRRSRMWRGDGPSRPRRGENLARSSLERRFPEVVSFERFQAVVVFELETVQRFVEEVGSAAVPFRGDLAGVVEQLLVNLLAVGLRGRSRVGARRPCSSFRGRWFEEVVPHILWG